MTQQVGSAEILADQPLFPAPSETYDALRPSSYPGRFFDGKTHCRLNDELTGIPWAFAPNKELPRDHEQGGVDGLLVADWHHAAHPRTELEEGTDAQQAVRHASIQWTMRSEHNDYHHANLQPLLPQTDREALVYVAARVARYVPPRALEFVHEGGKVVIKSRFMDLKDRKRIWGENQLKVEKHSKVRHFLGRYVLERGFEDLSDQTKVLRDKYLENPELVSIALLRSLVRVTVSESGFDKVYSHARKKSLIPAGAHTLPEDLLMSRLLPASFGYGLTKVNRLTLQRLQEAETTTLQQLHRAAIASAEGKEAA